MVIFMYHNGSVFPEYCGLVDGGEVDEGARVEIAVHGMHEEGTWERDHLSL